MSEGVVVVGASMGGLRLAESLRRFGYAGSIKVFGNEGYAPYNRPPLSKDLLSAAEIDFAGVAFPQRSATADVEWHLSAGAVSADLSNRQITISGGEQVSFEHLVIATGLRSKRLGFNTFPADRHALRSFDDAKALRSKLAVGSKLVIVGSGFIACEVAATATKLGCEVHIVSPSKSPMDRALGDQLSAIVKLRLEAQGITFHMRSTPRDLIGSDRLEAVALSDGSTIHCDTLVEAIGSDANCDWLAGNDLDISDGLLCDGSLRAVKASGGTWSNVFGVGDVARFPNPLFDATPRRIEHWNIPTESAKFVGQQIAASYSSIETTAEVFRPLPSFWSDQFDMHIFGLGMSYLADESKLVHGDISGDCVFEFTREGVLVGVVGIGHRSVVQNYRSVLER